MCEQRGSIKIIILTYTLVKLFTAVTSISTCPSGYQQYLTSCFRFGRTKVSYEYARDECLDANSGYKSELADINDPTTQAFVSGWSQQTLKSLEMVQSSTEIHQQFWIGSDSSVNNFLAKIVHGDCHLIQVDATQSGMGWTVKTGALDPEACRNPSLAVCQIKLIDRSSGLEQPYTNEIIPGSILGFQPAMYSPSLQTNSNPSEQINNKAFTGLQSQQQHTNLLSASLTPSASCQDKIEDWKDFYGYSCADYVQFDFCTRDKSYGAGWDTTWGTFETYAVEGIAATEACCQCGGEDVSLPAANSPRISKVSGPCKDKVDGWKDSFGYSCAEYVENAFCTPSKGYGSGWQPSWKTFSVYAVNGIDATDACCNCGGEDVSHKLLGAARIPKDPGPCEDRIKGWKDSYGYSCEDYSENSFCTVNKGYGSGWDMSWGTFQKFSVSGIDATEACCKCGGFKIPEPEPESRIPKVTAPPKPVPDPVPVPVPVPAPLPVPVPVALPAPVVPATPACEDLEGWKDSMDYTCSAYAEKSFCTAEKRYGSGWEASWGPFAVYAVNGIDATKACCLCGRSGEKKATVDSSTSQAGQDSGINDTLQDILKALELEKSRREEDEYQVAYLLMGDPQENRKAASQSQSDSAAVEAAAQAAAKAEAAETELKLEVSTLKQELEREKIKREKDEADFADLVQKQKKAEEIAKAGRPTRTSYEPPHHDNPFVQAPASMGPISTGPGTYGAASEVRTVTETKETEQSENTNHTAILPSAASASEALTVTGTKEPDQTESTKQAAVLPSAAGANEALTVTGTKEPDQTENTKQAAVLPSAEIKNEDTVSGSAVNQSHANDSKSGQDAATESKITENEEDHTDQADSSTSTTPESPGETDGAIASNSATESKITENEEDHTDQAESSTSTTPESPGETDGAIASNSATESKITGNEEDHTDRADSSTSTTPEETDGANASNSATESKVTEIEGDHIGQPDGSSRTTSEGSGEIDGVTAASSAKEVSDNEQGHSDQADISSSTPPKDPQEISEVTSQNKDENTSNENMEDISVQAESTSSTPPEGLVQTSEATTPHDVLEPEKDVNAEAGISKETKVPAVNSKETSSQIENENKVSEGTVKFPFSEANEKTEETEVNEILESLEKEKKEFAEETESKTELGEPHKKKEEEVKEALETLDEAYKNKTSKTETEIEKQQEQKKEQEETEEKEAVKVEIEEALEALGLDLPQAEIEKEAEVEVEKQEEIKEKEIEEDKEKQEEAEEEIEKALEALGLDLPVEEIAKEAEAEIEKEEQLEKEEQVKEEKKEEVEEQIEEALESLGLDLPTEEIAKEAEAEVEKEEEEEKEAEEEEEREEVEEEIEEALEALGIDLPVEEIAKEAEAEIEREEEQEKEEKEQEQSEKEAIDVLGLKHHEKDTTDHAAEAQEQEKHEEEVALSTEESPLVSSLEPQEKESNAIAADEATETCVDSPQGWTDSSGWDCSFLSENDWCTASGEHGSGWDMDWGDLRDFAVDGLDAFQVCCGCGGGVKGKMLEPVPEPMMLEQPEKEKKDTVRDETCVDSPEGWTDSSGWGCDFMEENSWCTPSGEHGSGWDLDWGTLADFEVDGLDAFKVCCSCGGGVRSASSMEHAAEVVELMETNDEIIKEQSELLNKLEEFKGELEEEEKAEEKLESTINEILDGSEAQLQQELTETAKELKDEVEEIKQPDKDDGLTATSEEHKDTDIEAENKDADNVHEMTSEDHKVADKQPGSADNKKTIQEQDDSHPAGDPEGTCSDSPKGWTDASGWDCFFMEDNGWCTPEGKHGPGWDTAWGVLSNFAVDGVDAFQACCSCGGGVTSKKNEKATEEKDELIKAETAEGKQEELEEALEKYEEEEIEEALEIIGLSADMDKTQAKTIDAEKDSGKAEPSQEKDDSFAPARLFMQLNKESTFPEFQKIDGSESGLATAALFETAEENDFGMSGNLRKPADLTMLKTLLLLESTPKQTSASDEATSFLLLSGLSGVTLLVFLTLRRSYSRRLISNYTEIEEQYISI